jgi:hypothetical protein
MASRNKTTRVDRAIDLYFGRAAWLHLRDRRTGELVAYAIPSQQKPGLYHVTDGRDCDCPDHGYRAVECKHMRAARLYQAALRERQAA